MSPPGALIVIMDWKTESACQRVASRQQGLITREKALTIGLSEDAILRRVASGKWRLMFPGVYAVSGSPDSWIQKLLGACLWADGIASHRAGAAVWGLEGFDARLIEVTTERRVRSCDSEVVVRRGVLDRRDRTIFNGIPVTTPSRTLLDLGAVADIDLLNVALQDALRKGLTTISRLRLLVDRVGGKGKPGVGALRTLVGDTLTPRLITETRLETRLLKLISDSGLPLPVPQYKIRVDRHVVARLDFAYPSEMLGIEGDSFAFHSAPEDVQRDRDRSNALTLLGWRILHVTWDDLVNRPNQVIEAIRASLSLMPHKPRSQAQGT